VVHRGDLRSSGFGTRPRRVFLRSIQRAAIFRN
jgi:hypothetical protein